MQDRELHPDTIWNENKREGLKKFIAEQASQQSADRVLKNKLLSIQYKIEDYIRSPENGEEEFQVLDFVKLYLEALGVSKRQLAKYFGMEDANLHKYLTGQRKLNTEITMKLSAFSHTKPEHWYYIQIKNDLMAIRRNKELAEEYNQYDYRNLVTS